VWKSLAKCNENAKVGKAVGRRERQRGSRKKVESRDEKPRQGSFMFKVQSLSFLVL